MNFPSIKGSNEPYKGSRNPLGNDCENPGVIWIRNITITLVERVRLRRRRSSLSVTLAIEDTARTAIPLNAILYLGYVAVVTI